MTTGPIAHLDALERALASAKFPHMTAWWRQTLREFYASGRKQLVLRVGRRGGKSSSLCRVAVLEALYGEHIIPPGDVGIVGFVSVSREEAASRLRTVKRILDTLGVSYKPIDGGIELVDRPIAFKTFAATLAGVVGGTWICGVCDEVARWRDTDSGANPATEVLASLRPTFAGQPSAKLFLSTSPLGKLDAHAVAFDKGDNEFQLVRHAATWVARPNLTEAECRTLEPDEEMFQGEYGARPRDGSALSLFSGAQLDAVTRRGPSRVPPETGVLYFAATDPATRANAWTLVIARAHEEGKGTASVQIVSISEWRAARGGALDSDLVFSEIATELAPYGVRELVQDQWSFDANRSIAARHGITLLQEPATQTTKTQLFEALRRRVLDRTIELPEDRQLKADLLGVRKWIGKGGAPSIELERVGTRHCDYASAVVLAVDQAASSVRAQKSPPAIETSIVCERDAESSLGVMSDAFLDGLTGDIFRSE